MTSEVKQSDQKTQINTFSTESIDPASLVSRGSLFNKFKWLVALALLVLSTLLTRYVVPYVPQLGQSVYKVVAMVLLIVVALAILATTHQGKGLLRLLVDARIELVKIVWPEKSETVRATWLVMAVVSIVAVILWILDTFFNWLIQLVV